MKKTLKLMPEYQCYPLWLYDSDGTLIDNIIPESLQSNKELMDALTSVQQQFDALYTNAPQTYPYVGFPDEKSKERFIHDSWRAYELLCNAARNEYEVFYAIDYEAL